jgi:hypothetical protein
MNAKFEWFGFSVARKHVYFYAILLSATLAANAMKDQLVGGPSLDKAALAELDRITEQVASLRAVPPEP